MLASFKAFVLNETKVKSDEKIDIYRDEDYIIVEVLSHNASCKYGAFTDWCISVPHYTGAWNAANNVKHVIFIINKNFKPNEERIQELKELDTKKNSVGLDNDEFDKYLELLSDEECHDLSKMALIIGKDHQELWGANNVDLTEFYEDFARSVLDELPISQDAKDAIEDYLENAKQEKNQDVQYAH